MLENLINQTLRGPTLSGEMPQGDLEALRKALEAGYGTDMSALTGGAAIRVQSLDATLQATLADNKHFKLFNALPKPNATATVDEWTEATDQGGFPGGSTNTESGTISEANGTYARRVGLVKYLMTQCKVSYVATLQSSIVEAEAIENQMGTLRLLRDAEVLSFFGDSAVVPTEYDGIFKQIAGDANLADHVLNADAASLASVNLINDAAAIIAGYGNFGVPTDLFMSPKVQADWDTGLDPAFRVPLADVPGGGIEVGAPVVGIRTSHGNIRTQADVFVPDQDQQTPFELRYSAIATAQASIAPASVTGVAATGTSVNKFTAARAGNYYYAVAGVNAAGQSTVTKTAQIAVTSGQKVTLTINRSAGAQETGYVIYRSRKNGTNATNDFRYMAKVAVAGATTTYVDENLDIPGTTPAFVLNLTPGHTAITWRQLLPLTRFQLYPVNAAVVPWALLLFGYLRISKRRQHVVIKNILPNNSVWQPFA
jgi:hypothetical protein